MPRKPQQPPEKVLFVCVHGVNSARKAGEFRAYLKARGLQANYEFSHLKQLGVRFHDFQQTVLNAHHAVPLYGNVREDIPRFAYLPEGPKIRYGHWFERLKDERAALLDSILSLGD